jgi:hypothetical protein
MTGRITSGIVSSMATNMMGGTVDQAEKVRENRVRRLAERRGYELSKSRRRDEFAVDFGQWSLTRGAIGVGATSFPMQTITLPSLDDVEAFVLGVPKIEVELRREGQAYVESRGQNREGLQSLVREAIKLGMPLEAVAFVSEIPVENITALSKVDA